MAKATIGFSKSRGKVGGIVFRSMAGVGTVASEYNPAPANPRTLAQTKQRSKMNLAGLFSKLTLYPLIAGLAANKRMARSGFVSRLIKAAAVTGTGTTADPFVAAVAPADVVFSIGATDNVPVISCEYGAQYVGIILDDMEESARNFSAAIGIAVISKDGKVVEVASAVKNFGSTASLGNIEMATSTDMSSGTISVDCYLVPIMIVDGATSAQFDNNIDFANSVYSVSVARTLSTLGAYGASRYLGKADAQE